MTGTSAVQAVPLDAPVTAAAAAIAQRILDTTTCLDQAFDLAAQHLLTWDRVDVVTLALTAAAPEDPSRWVHLGERAWVTEWRSPHSRFSILPPADAGPEGALSMPWISPRARRGALVIADVDPLPAEADEDRVELRAYGIRSLVVQALVSDGVMFGSIAAGSGDTGAWPDEYVADFRLLSVSLTSRVALQQARRSLAEAVAANAQRRDAHHHFLASLGHELRTPLSAIIGNTELLLDEASEHPEDPFAREVGRDGSVILRSCEQLKVVLEDLLAAGRVVGEAGVRQSVNVRSAVADVVHWHQAAAATAQVSVTSDIPAEASVWGHPPAVRQVIACLVSNAVIHNKPGGSLALSAEELIGEGGEPRLRVIVRDDGPGLSPEQLAQVFEPFVRFAGPDAQGTGLGLSLSRTIAERDGGTIGAESTPGQGSAFWVELPCTGDDQLH